MSRFRQLVADATVDINFKTGYGETPLLLLCTRNQSGSLLPALQALLRRRDVDLQSTYSGYNALNLLIRFYRQPNLIHCVRLLIEKGVNANKIDKDDQTALSVLCHLGHGEDLIDIARLFVRRMLDPGAVIRCSFILADRGLHQESEILEKMTQLCNDRHFQITQVHCQTLF